MRMRDSTVLILGIGAGSVALSLVLSSRGRRGAGMPHQIVDPPGLPPVPDTTTIPSHPVQVVKSAPPPPPMAPEVETMVRELTRPNMTPSIPPPPPPSGTPDDFTAQAVRDLVAPQTTSAQRSPRQAATDLYAHVVQAVRAGDAGPLGSKASPSNYVAAAQRDMRLLTSDGIYGPKTAARGKELLGREFPARDSAKRRVPASVINQLPASAAQVLSLPPPVPASLSTAVSDVSPMEAANALYLLVTHPPVDWGSKTRPNTLIRDAQRDMGGLVADGIYGPKTQAKGKLLTGKAFPARK